MTGEGEVLPTPSWAVHSVSIFDPPSILLEFNSPEVKSFFADLCNDNPQLLHKISPKAQICPWAYMVIFPFISCNGTLTPATSPIFRTLNVTTISRSS